MKKVIFILLVAAVGSFFYYQKIHKEKLVDTEYKHTTQVLDEGEIIVVPPVIEYDNTNRYFDNKETDKFTCKDDDAVCAVDLAVKCTINPKLSFCDKNKLPRFIFMDDDALGRPKKINYTVVKVHPIDLNTVEIQTKSDCDGIWFGLCNGNIIYVVNNSGGSWVVKEIYALETY